MRFLFVILFLLAAADGGRKGNDAYDRGDYVTAEREFRAAINDSPDDARLYFNLGNALAKQGKMDEAISAYERFKDMSTSPADRALADYNIGNIYAMQEEWERAVEQYRASLRQNPADSDAKFNYELANRNREEQMQNPDQSPEQGDSSDDQQDQQQQDQQQSDSDGDQDQQQNQQEDQQQQGDENQQQPQSRPMPEPNMTPEEADRILNALENNEKELLKDFHKNQIPSNTRHARNW